MSNLSCTNISFWREIQFPPTLLSSCSLLSDLHQILLELDNSDNSQKIFWLSHPGHSDDHRLRRFYKDEDTWLFHVPWVGVSSVPTPGTSSGYWPRSSDVSCQLITRDTVISEHCCKYSQFRQIFQRSTTLQSTKHTARSVPLFCNNIW